MAILPARPFHPRDKPAIEAAVHVTENWILAPLRKRQFFSLAEANAAVAEQLALVNDRPFRGQPVSRRALFEELERAALQPLPTTRYELAEWKSAKVNIDYHVEFDTRYYSVPYQLVHEPVEVRATAHVVEILHRNRRVSQPRARVRPAAVSSPSQSTCRRRIERTWSGRRQSWWPGAPASDHRSPS